MLSGISEQRELSDADFFRKVEETLHQIKK
jgi:hypothetical protein